MRGQKPRRNRERAPKPVWLLILLDLLLTAALMCLFFSCKLLLPALKARQVVVSPAPTVNAEPTAEPVAATPEATPDTRTPWQIRFAEHFSAEPVMTESSYHSPQTAIEIRTFTREYGSRKAVCHVADVYLARPEQFCTYTANNELKYWSVQDVGEMDAAAHAILSVNGDCYSYQQYALLLRNGVLYKSDHPYEDICVLYPDGRMATYARKDYEVETLLSEEPAQIWCFGPALLDAEGHVKPYYETSTTVGYQNPRCAIGYYEPGHYCFVVVDGRQSGYSDGMLIDELAAVFEELGCKAAYNLDGGGSAVMFFNHSPFSQQSNGADREIGDILLITEEGFA